MADVHRNVTDQPPASYLEEILLVSESFRNAPVESDICHSKVRTVFYAIQCSRCDFKFIRENAD